MSEPTDRPDDVQTDAGISEAASENQMVENHREVERLCQFLPLMSPEERAEREGWKKTEGKRGRPRMAPDDYYPSMPIEKHHAGLGHYVGTTAKTGRGRQNAQYASWALRTLFEHRAGHPEILELTGVHTVAATARRPAYDIPGMILARKNIGVLAEFGRLICRYSDGEEAAVEWAVELVRMRPRLTSKQTVAWLRRRRLRKTNLGNSEGVMGAITAALDTYLASHPGTSNKAIVDALNGALWLYSPGDEEP